MMEDRENPKPGVPKLWLVQVEGLKSPFGVPLDNQNRASVSNAFDQYSPPRCLT